jgi:flagellar biosynthetic protein FliR
LRHDVEATVNSGPDDDAQSLAQLFAGLSELAGWGEGWLWPAFLVFLRIGAMMALLPAFGETVIPGRIRLVLILAFCAIVLPAVAPQIIEVKGIPAVATEVVVGLMLGIGLRLFVFALQIAGEIAAQSTSLAQVFAGPAAEPQPAIGNVLTMSGLAIAVAAGLHIRAAMLIILSYDLFPVGRLPSSSDATAWGVERTAQAFALAFCLAAPFVLAAAVYQLALGIINRAIPQLMVFFVGAPLLTAGGLTILALVAVPALEIWRDELLTFTRAPLGSSQ